MLTADLLQAPAFRARPTLPGRAVLATDRRPPAPRRLHAGSSAGEAFQVIARSCVDRFRFNEALFARTDDAEALHQMRVSLRQLRSALSIFAPIVADDRFGPLRRELRWLTATMNDARDLDVLIARIDDPPASLSAARKLAYAEATRGLRSARARRLMPMLVEWLDHGVWRELRNPPDVTAAAFAATSLDRLRRKLRKKGRHLRGLDDAELHELRIAAKKLRYATEFFAGLFPLAEPHDRREPFVRALRGLQDRLGELQDRAVAPALLERLQVPRTSWPEIPRRKQLLKRADVQFDRWLEARPFWP
jgi:CHAD domain-containing protein